MKKHLLFIVLFLCLQIPCIKACFACSTAKKEPLDQNNFVTNATIQSTLDNIPHEHLHELYMLRQGALAVQKTTEVTKEGKINYIFSHTQDNVRCSVRVRIPKKINTVLAEISLTATQEHMPEIFKGIDHGNTKDKDYTMSIATTGNSTTFWMSLNKDFFNDKLVAQNVCAALKKTLTRKGTFIPSNSVKIQLIQEFAAMATHFKQKDKASEKKEDDQEIAV